MSAPWSTALPPAATGVGSLPHLDPEEAVEFLRRAAPFVPFLPELPRRGPEETLIGAALAGLRRELVPAEEPGAWRVRELVSLERAAQRPLRRPSGAAWPAFARALRAGACSSARALKLQSVGPWTLASALLWEGAPLGATPRGARLALALALRAARARLAAAEELGLPILLALDEPGLAGAHPDEIARARALVRSAFRALRGPGRRVGLHVCSAVDAGLLRGLGAELLSCPRLAGPAGSLADPRALFGARGGILICGAVPTSPAASAEALPPAQQLEARWSLGSAWIGGVLFSATCGYGLLDARSTEAGFARTAELAARWRPRARGRSTALGAPLRAPAPPLVVAPATPWVRGALELLGCTAEEGAPPALWFGGREPRPGTGRAARWRVGSSPRRRGELEFELLRLGHFTGRLAAAARLVGELRRRSRRPFPGALAELRQIAARIGTRAT